MTFRAGFGTRGTEGEPCPASERAVVSSPRAYRLSFLRSARVGIALWTLLGVACLSALGQHGHSSPPPSAHASAPSHPPAGAGRSGPPARPGNQSRPPSQQHLNEWLQHNQGLSPQEQARKLQQEPGFNRLPPEQQQRLTQRLNQVNRMPPDQRERTLERVENIERLPPTQQQQIRGSAVRLGQLPPQRQQVMRDAIRSLRNVPPGLRQSELNSSKYSGLSPEERGIVGNLLTVESYHPAPPPPR
ncbi:DUF3106 domain-containing protein [Acidisarcina polymorpha]|uniref:DUF3106 domain-containing protein n=1 Tax=Acidisarcina polymorpha TaxID=2211140 RepID=UPI000DEF5E2D